MMRSIRLRVSLVIPAYNEESHLRACLDSVAAQIEAPFEVIVVDNNSTDQTAAIARRFSFVRLISEPQQGRVFARNAGFSAARGDIIARLDADVAALPDWTQRVRQAFERDDNMAAVTGLTLSSLLPRTHFGRSRYWMRLYFWWTEAYFGVRLLSGPNFALRRSVWESVKSSVCLDDDLVHEDQDLSLLIVARGGRIQLDSHLLVLMDDTSINEWTKFSESMRRRWRTKLFHITSGTFVLARQRHMMLPWWYRAGTLAMIALPGVPFIILSVLLGLPSIVKKVSFSLQTRFANARSFLDMGDN